MGGEFGHGEHHASPLVSSAVGSPSATHSFFWASIINSARSSLWRRRALSRSTSGETISPVALRAPSATVSPEEPDNPSKEDFNNEVMCMSYLYSKLPE